MMYICNCSWNLNQNHKTRTYYIVAWKVVHNLEQKCVDNLQRLKRKTIEWARKKKKRDEESPKHIETKLALLEQRDSGRYDSVESKLWFI